VTWAMSTGLGTVTVPDAVLAEIAARAAESVDGVRVRRRRTVDVEAGLVRLAVAVRKGEPIFDLASSAQDAIATALQTMCGIDPKVEIAVGELA
jgi:uncharacterized alkaline shock family protein YloU